VANELKKEGAVYFVERNRVGMHRLEMKQVEPNVFVLTPYFWMHYKVRYRTQGLNEAYHNWLLTRIQALHVPFDLVLNFDFTAPAVTAFFDNVIFYSVDDNVGFGNFNPAFINRYHTHTEKLAAQNAKMCIVTSDYMHSKLTPHNPLTHVVPLGAPPVTFGDIRPPRKKEGAPVLGLVGYLDSNLDYTLLGTLLEKYKVVFIGPANKSNRKRLSRYPNAVLAGTKTGDDLYRCLQEVDVCIAPYDESKINKGATPNKMWLYLAMGKPAVVTNIPNIRNWHFEDKLVYKCDNADFVATCMQAFTDDTIELVHKRIELSKQNSWSSRINRVKELYSQRQVLSEHITLASSDQIVLS
jgi:hypothetical protein